MLPYASVFRRFASSHSSKLYLRRQGSDPYVLQAQLSGLRSRAAFKLLDIQERLRVIKKGDLVVDLGAAPGSWSQVAADLAGRGSSFFSPPTATTGPLAVSVPITPSAEPSASLQQAPGAQRPARKSLFSLTALSAPASASPAIPTLPKPSPGAGAGRSTYSVIALDLLPIDPPIDGVLSLRGDFNSRAIQEQLVSAMRNKKADALLCDMAQNFSGISDSDAAIQMHLAWNALLFAASHLKQGGNVVIKVRYGADYKLFSDTVKKLFRRAVEIKPPASRAESAESYMVGLSAKAEFVSSDRKAQAPGSTPAWVENDAAVKTALLQHGLLR